MHKNLEEELSQLPQFSPPVAFRDALRNQLHQEKRQSRPLMWRFGTLAVASIVLLAIALHGFFNKTSWLYPQQVAASEIIQVFLTSHFKPNTITHRQMVQFTGEKSQYQGPEGRYFDNWQDQNSDRWFQYIVISGQPTDVQGNNLEFIYHIIPQENQILLFPNDYPPEEREMKHGGELDIAEWMNHLLSQQELQAQLTTDHGRSVYQIIDYRPTSEKSWDSYYFDAKTKQLIAVEKELDGFYDRIDYLLIESLERTPENLALFDFPPKGMDISNLPVLRQITNPETGNYDFIEVYPPDYQITLPDDVVTEILLDDELNEYTVPDVEMLESSYEQYTDPITGFSFSKPVSSIEQTSSTDNSSLTTFSFDDQSHMSLSTSPNLDPNTNQAYASMSEVLPSPSHSFTWSQGISGKYVKADGSVMFAFLNPTQTHVLTLKMSIDPETKEPSLDAQNAINTATF